MESTGRHFVLVLEWFCTSLVPSYHDFRCSAADLLERFGHVSMGKAGWSRTFGTGPKWVDLYRDTGLIFLKCVLFFAAGSPNTSSLTLIYTLRLTMDQRGTNRVKNLSANDEHRLNPLAHGLILSLQCGSGSGHGDEDSQGVSCETLSNLTQLIVVIATVNALAFDWTQQIPFRFWSILPCRLSKASMY